jgi:hypothetical protein
MVSSKTALMDAVWTEHAHAQSGVFNYKKYYFAISASDCGDSKEYFVLGSNFVSL